MTSTSRKRNLCEECNVKCPSFGLPDEGKRRWCGGCRTKFHPDAVNLVPRASAHPQFEKGEHVKCPNCEAWMAAPTDERVDGLICAGCDGNIWPKAKPANKRAPQGNSDGTASNKKQKPATTREEPKKTKKQQKMCEDCYMKCASYGLESDNKRRWCKNCSAMNRRGGVCLVKKKGA
jgi:hypothetical protein